MAGDDEARESRSCGDCANLQYFSGVSFCVCTGRETRPGHDATECGAYRWGWGEDAEDD
jgi:hypothetical protein